MAADAVVRGARVALPDGTSPEADVAIADGRIAGVGAPGSLAAETLIDARGRLLVPGAIDVHVHLREPGATHKDDFATGTRAAACGGVTVVCDMPSTLPPVVSAERLRQKRELVAPRAWVDFGLWAGGTDVAEFAGMASEGAVGLKVYMVTAPGYDELYTRDEATLRRVLQAAAELGWLVAVHVGDEAIAARERAALLASGRRDARAVRALGRGEAPLAGLRAIAQAARATGARLHVAHLSMFGGPLLDAYLGLRRGGLGLTGETAVPALGDADLDRLGVFALATALEDDVRARYWRALADGDIDVIATDHAPHTRAEKEQGRDDAWAAPPGFPAVQVSLALAFDAVLRGCLTLPRLVALTAGTPAALLGLAGKGRIEVGRDADLVVLDPERSWTVDEAALVSKVGWSPYHGRTLRGRVERTLLRGVPVAVEGEVVAERPCGRPVRPA